MKIYQFINITPTLSVLNLRVNICRKFNGKYMHGILYFGVMVGLEQLEIVNVKQVRIQTECAPSTVFSIFGCCWSVRILS